MTAQYTTPSGILYRGAKAVAKAAEAGSNKFATRVTHVKWTEIYDIDYGGKHYEVIRSRSPGKGWRFTSVYSISNQGRWCWCEPDKPTFKRVVAALLSLIEV